MHGRDITILIVLLWCTTSACFSTFLLICYHPYSSWKLLIFNFTSLLTFFANNIDCLMNPCILHHAWGSNGSTCLNYIWEWSIHCSSLSAMFTPLHSSTNQELFKKYVCNLSSYYEKHDGAARPSYHLKPKYPFPFSISYVQLVTQQYESITVWKAPL